MISSNLGLGRASIPVLQSLPKIRNQGLQNINKCICHLVFAEQEDKNLVVKEVEYDIKIVENIAEITINQTYVNPLTKAADVEYLFSIEPEAVFAKLIVTIGDRKLQGVVKEKEEARAEYQEKVSQGHTMVYSEQDDIHQDIMRVKLGNLMPGDNLQISLTYYEQLQVCVNKFWRLSIPTTFMPRYKGKDLNLQDMPNQVRKYYKQRYTLQEIKFNLTIQTSSSLTYLKSPSHNLVQLERNDKFVKFQQLITPTGKDFQVLYSTATINQPTAVVSQMSGDENAHQRTCVTVSLIPEFNTLPTEDAYLAYAQDNFSSSDHFDFDASNQKGFFIFVIDRSGSMDGTNITKAKEALILFLRSLPVDSYVQIVSFGSGFDFLWEGEQKFDQNTLQYAIQMVSQFSADMGGTEILEPLFAIQSIPDKKGYPTNIFILTDGGVSNTEQVAQQSSQMKSPTRRIYTLGIGNGCSRYLVEKVALMGNGKYVFVADEENLNEKVIDLLQDSITPFLQDIKIEIQNPQGLVALIPDPSSITCVRKSEPLTFFALFNSEAEKEIKFKISCWDSLSSSTKGYESTVKPDIAQETPIFHKLAAHRLIQSVEKAYKYDMYTSEVLYAKKDLSQKDIVEIAVQNQILCSQTAFICEATDKIEGDALHQILREKIYIQVKNQAQIQYNRHSRIQLCMAPSPFQQSLPGCTFSSAPQLQPQSQSNWASPQPPPIFANQPQTLGFYNMAPPPPPPSFERHALPPPPPQPQILGLQKQAPPPPPPGFAQPQPPSCPFSIGVGGYSQASQAPPIPKPQIQMAPSSMQFAAQPQSSAFSMPSAPSFAYESTIKQTKQDVYDLMDFCENEINTDDFAILDDIQDGSIQEEGEQSLKNSNQSLKVQDNFKLVLPFQDFTGKFIYSPHLLAAIGIDDQRFKQAWPKDMLIDFWITIFIMEWLETYCLHDQKSWQLIFKKARDFLNQNHIKYQEVKGYAKQVF